MTDPCFKGPTNFPQRPQRRPDTDKAAWMTWDMLRWFVTTVFDPFAKCVDAKPAGQSVETLNDPLTVDVNPTEKLQIGSGLILTNPSAGLARIDAVADSDITTIESTDGSIVVTDPTGPVVDLVTRKDPVRYIILTSVGTNLGTATPSGTLYQVDWNALYPQANCSTDDDTGSPTTPALNTTFSYTNFSYDHTLAPGHQLKIIREGLYSLIYTFGPRVTFTAANFQVAIYGVWKAAGGNGSIQWVNTAAFGDTNDAYVGGTFRVTPAMLPFSIDFAVGQLSGGAISDMDGSIQLIRIRSLLS